MLRQLQEQFWDTLYPEIEDGDAEFRSTPLSWLGNFDLQIRTRPITKGGKSAVDLKTAQSVGYKAAAEESSEKLETFNEKIAEGKISMDDFDVDFEKTPKQYYVDLEQTLQSCLDEIAELQRVGEEKFGDDYAPGYSKLRSSVEETKNTVRILLNRKREKEPDADQDYPQAGEETVEETGYAEESAAGAGQPAARRKAGGPQAAEPQDMDDAVARIAVVARYLRAQDAYSPAPYLLLAGFRFGELRASGDSVDQSKLDAPPSDLRQQIKKASMESQWEEVLKCAESALCLSCGRGWLDLHRYAWRACSELGWYYTGLQRGIVAEVRGVLQTYPDLPKLTLMDDTPTANGETAQWIETEVLAGQQAAPVQDSYSPPPAVAPHGASNGEEAGPPDAWDLAQQALRGGRLREAVELIDREAKMEQSGRGRFIRKTQLAKIFIDSGNEPMALPLLEQLAAEIESRGLEDWELSDTIAHPLLLLYRCMARSDKDGEAARKLYAKLCRLDPVAAMNVLR